MIAQTPLAFSPASVTCFFLPRRGPSPAETVSMGCAITLRDGVTARVEPAPAAEVLLNGRPLALPPVDRVLRRLAPSRCASAWRPRWPSAAASGSAARPPWRRPSPCPGGTRCRRSRQELGLVAHEAEVVSRTGIGDVGAQLCGGVVHRRCREGPFDCVRLDVPHPPLYYRVFGPLDTVRVLESEATLAAIRREGRRVLDWLESRPDGLGVASILERSLEFSTRAGLLGDEALETAIAAARRSGGSAAMILLGRSVLSTVRPAVEPEAWTECRIDTQGTRWL